MLTSRGPDPPQREVAGAAPALLTCGHLAAVRQGGAMYRHILVPLHSGDLAFEVVGRALALARPLGARVTFFHALQDPECLAAGPFELLHLDSPDLRDTRRTGRTRELLAKAEAGARALGVPCDARWSRG